jgi:hypothetical protein
MPLPHRPASRPGFTLVELLIAASLGVFVTGLAVQHTYEYFRLKATLVAKSELRHATQQIQERVGQKLRYALYVVPVKANEYILVVPQDVDRCGYVCHLDRYELLWWQVAEDPLATEARGYLAEKRIVTPAFEMPGDTRQVMKLFDVYKGEGRRLGSWVEGVEIRNEGPGLFRTKVTVARTMPRQPEPAKMAFMELVAARSKPRIQGVPKIETLLGPPGKGGGGGVAP